MSSSTAANTGTAIRSLLTWLLVLLVVANIVVWSAWPTRDKLVTLGILAPPPIERVDLEPQPLPPIVERADPSLDQPFESRAAAEPESEKTENVGRVPSEEDPSASPTAPGIAGQPAENARPSSDLLDCVIVGPVESREGLEAAALRLRSAGARVDSPEELGVLALDYHVYVEPSASWQAAEAVQKELDAQFIEDTDIIKSGTYEKGVSVGVHRHRNLAEARRDRIAGLGYAVKVRERHRLRAREVSTDALGGLDYEPCPDDGAG